MEGWSSVPNWVIRSDKLHGTEKWVYITLLNRANAKGECWPSLSTLQKEVGVSKNTVLKTLRSLENKGLILRLRRRGDGKEYSSNLYRINAWEGCSEIELGGSNENQGVVQELNKGGSNESQEVLPIEVLPIRSTTQGKNAGEVIEVESVPGGTNTARQVPDPFILTTQMKEWAAKNVHGLDLVSETQEFVAYWRHGEGRGKRKKNWYLTWQNRMKQKYQWLPAEAKKQRKVKVFNDEVD